GEPFGSRDIAGLERDAGFGQQHLGLRGGMGVVHRRPEAGTVVIVLLFLLVVLGDVGARDGRRNGLLSLCLGGLDLGAALLRAVAEVPYAVGAVELLGAIRCLHGGVKVAAIVELASVGQDANRFVLVALDTSLLHVLDEFIGRVLEEAP